MESLDVLKVIAFIGVSLFVVVKRLLNSIESIVPDEPQADKAPLCIETSETDASPGDIVKTVKERKQAAVNTPSAQPETPLEEPLAEHRGGIFKNREDIKKAIIFSEIFNKKYN